MRSFLIALLALLPVPLWAASDTFPPYEEAPAYTTYFADGVPNHVYHVRTTGNDSTGDGSYNNAWASLAGGQGTIAAGDLVLFHEGDYTDYTHSSDSGGSWRSTNYCTTSGSSDDRIVIMAANKHASYTGESTPVIISTGNELCTSPECLAGTSHPASDYGMGMTLAAYQVVDGIHFQTCISTAAENVVIQNNEFSAGGSGQRDGNAASILIPGESVSYNIDIRNNSFHDPLGFHDHDASASHATRCYAIIIFSTTDTGNGTRIRYNKFYNWNEPASQEYIVYLKDTAHSVEVSYNRFYNSTAFCVAGFGQTDAAVTKFAAHHNLAYNCMGFAEWWGYGAGDGAWYNNVIIDSSYAGTSYGFHQPSDPHPHDSPWGSIYNNIIYVDDPGESDDTSPADTGYWEIVYYNAFRSTAERDAFENAGDSSTNWLTNDQTTEQTITMDADYFATVADGYPYKTAGKDHDCIGGWTFVATPAPPTISNCTISNGLIQ